MKSALIAIIVAIAASAASAGPLESVNEVKTVGGTLRAADSGVTLNKVAIKQGGKPAKFDDNVSFVGIYKVGEKDVVLINSQCGGSACGTFSSISVLTIGKDGTAVLAGKDLDTDGEGYNKVVPVGNTLEIETRTVQDRRRFKTLRWVYADGQVRPK